MAGPAGHEEKDDRLGLRLVGHVRRLRGQGIRARGAGGVLLMQHCGVRQRAETAERIADELASIAGQPNMFGHHVLHVSRRRSQFTYKKAFRLSMASANSRSG